MFRFFLDEQVLGAESEEVFPVRLAADDAAHARVLRLAPGEHIAIVDAVQDYFECEIVSVDADALLVRIAAREDAASLLANEPTVVLAQGLAKGDKMESIVRHATEVGASAFVPLRCERCVVKLDEKKAQAKVKRWNAIAKSAAMQAGRAFVPEVADPMNVRELCEFAASATCVLVCWEEAPASADLHEAIASALLDLRCPAADARIVVVVGPEGGLTPEEAHGLVACNPRGALVSLGPSILRTETAGVVAPALVLYELRRMMGATNGDILTHGVVDA